MKQHPKTETDVWATFMNGIPSRANFRTNSVKWHLSRPLQFIAQRTNLPGKTVIIFDNSIILYGLGFSRWFCFRRFSRVGAIAGISTSLCAYLW